MHSKIGAITFQTTGAIRACPKEPPAPDPCAPCGGGFYVDATKSYPDGGTKIAGADGYTGSPVAGVGATAIKTPEECQAKCAVGDFDS